MDSDEARYAFHNYGHLMTPKEKFAVNYLRRRDESHLGAQ